MENSNQPRRPLRHPSKPAGRPGTKPLMASTPSPVSPRADVSQSPSSVQKSSPRTPSVYSPASPDRGRHQSVLAMHPRMFLGVPVTPMAIDDTMLIAWRLALTEDTQVMCTLSASLVTSDGFTWTAILGGPKWQHFPEQFRQVVEQSNNAAQEEGIDSNGRRKQLYFTAFHAFQAGIEALPIGNYSLSKRLLDLSGRPCAAETYSWRVASWFGRRTYITDPAGVASPIQEMESGIANVSAVRDTPGSNAPLVDPGPDPTQWSVDEVCMWLTEERLGIHASTFREHDIDGEMLFELDEEMLIEDLKIASKLEIRKILTKRSHLEKKVGSISQLDTTFAAKSMTLRNMVSKADLEKLEGNANLNELTLDLRNGHFGLDQARELVDMLELNTSVTSLHFIALGNDEAALLSDALRSTPQIVAVNLVSNCEITDPVVVQSIYDRTWFHANVEVLKEIAGNANHITSLTWNRCALGNDMALRLGRALRPNTVLRRLVSTGNFFGTSGLETLYEVLSSKQHIEHLQILGVSNLTNLECNVDYAPTMYKLFGEQLPKFLEECRGIDTGGRGYVTWDEFRSCCRSLEIEISSAALAMLRLETGCLPFDANFLYGEILKESCDRDTKCDNGKSTEKTDRYTDPNHGSFSLTPTPNPEIVQKMLQLEQAVRDNAFQRHMTAVFQALAMNNPDVDSIRWGGQGLGDTVGLRLVKTLKGNMYVKNLELQHNNFSRAVLSELATIIEPLDKLETLVLLPMPNITDDVALSELRELEQRIKDRTWCRENERLLARLSSNSPCEELSCEGLGLGDGVALELAQALHSNCTLQSLKISGNQFGPPGIKALLAVLRANKSLVDLTWFPQRSSVSLDLTAQMIDLQRNFRQTQILRQLVTNDESLQSLSRRHFKELTFNWLAGGPLAFNTSVVEIDISGCHEQFRSDHSCARTLIKLLASNRTIKTVKTGNIFLSRSVQDVIWSRRNCDSFAAMLSRVVSNDEELVEVRTLPGFGDRGASSLTRALRYNTNVKTVILEQNYLSHNGTRELLNQLWSTGRSVLLADKTNSMLVREVQALSDRRWCNSKSSFLKQISNSDPDISSVCIQGENVGDTVAYRIAEALRSNTSLIKFELTNSMISESGVKALLDSLRQNPSLVDLKLLPNEHITDRSVLTRIDVVQHRVSGRKVLQQIAANDPSIKSLFWADKGVDDDLACAVADVLRGSIHVTQIDLSGNVFNDAGALALLESISNNKNIAMLKLLPADRVRSRPPRCVKSLLTGTTGIPTLVERMARLEQDIKDRHWIDENRELLDGIAADSSSITELKESCSGEGIGDAAIFQLVEALECRRNAGDGSDGHSFNSSVKAIDISNNNMTSKSAACFLDIVKAMELEELCMLPNPMISDPKLVSTIEEEEQKVHDRAWCQKHQDVLHEIEENSESMTKLDWSCSGIGDAVAKELEAALERNSNLVSINLSRNLITNSGARSLLARIQKNTSISEVKLLPNVRINDHGLISELKLINSIFSEGKWRRPRKHLKSHHGSGDGNEIPFVWNPTDRDMLPRAWLNDWEPFDFYIDGDSAWTLLPQNVIRFDKALPCQVQRANTDLTPQAMRRRRDQLAIRLSKCLPQHLHEFVKVIEANQVEWDKFVYDFSQH